MANLPRDVTVIVSDPALPFERVLVSSAGIDTWHSEILITKEIREQLPHIEEHSSKGILEVSGGMSLLVPVVTIGLEIGSTTIPEVRALVVDRGTNDVLLGKSIFREIFRKQSQAEQPKEEKVSSKPASEDPESLSVELYPTNYPFSSKSLENFLAGQRQLYNTTLIALRRINPAGLSKEAIDAIIDDDEGIPDHLRLKISSVEDGSVLVKLTSGCKDALKYMSSVFEKGASAKLAQELAEAENAEVRASISKETRDATALEIRAEKEKLSTQHIHETYRRYREEAQERLTFLDGLIGELSDSELRAQLTKKKDQVILDIADQMMVPVVRHVPDSHSALRTNSLALPPSATWKPGDLDE